MAGKSISIVIVNYNVKELLRSCIASIIRHSGVLDPEIIVVDNASVDGSEALIRKEFPAVRWIANATNVGFSPANNQGIEAAEGVVIVLLNPDTELESDVFSRLLEVLECNGPLDLVVPRLLNSDHSLQPSCWRSPGLAAIVAETFYLHKIFGLTSYPTDYYTRDFDPEAVSGAVMMFRRNVYTTIGGLDPDLFWMEDTDFCFRIRKAGGKIHFVSGTAVVHHSGKSSVKNYHIAVSNQLLSKIKYMRKHRSVAITAIAAIFIFLHICTRLLILLFMSIVIPSSRIKLHAYWFSLKRFFSYVFSGDKKIT
jgi:GT2 family glycosyltransferase